MVDTSALMAIVLDEHDAELFATALDRATRLVIGAPTALEARLVARHKLDPPDAMDELLALPNLEIVAWDAEHLRVATEAFDRYGGRPTRLNFGDCMTYAVAKSLDAPLLYKGDGFARTDIRSAL